MDLAKHEIIELMVEKCNNYNETADNMDVI